MTVRALVFDFDGLILETERPDYQTWHEIYQEHGLDLPLGSWVTIIGGGQGGWDPFSALVEQLGHDVDRTQVLKRAKARHLELVAELEVLPGVREALNEARRLGLQLGVASSSSRGWVEHHLERLGLIGWFHCVRCREDVAATKPDPELYLSVCRCLGIEPTEAVAFEDSPNGIAAARAAGLACVAIPNPLTVDLDLSAADLRLNSLADLPLRSLLDSLLRGERSGRRTRG